MPHRCNARATANHLQPFPPNAVLTLHSYSFLSSPFFSKFYKAIKWSAASSAERTQQRSRSHRRSTSRQTASRRRSWRTCSSTAAKGRTTNTGITTSERFTHYGYRLQRRRRRRRRRRCAGTGIRQHRRWQRSSWNPRRWRRRWQQQQHSCRINHRWESGWWCIACGIHSGSHKPKSRRGCLRRRRRRRRRRRLCSNASIIAEDRAEVQVVFSDPREHPLE